MRVFLERTLPIIYTGLGPRALLLLENVAEGDPAERLRKLPPASVFLLVSVNAGGAHAAAGVTRGK
jgi:hypothetical protein